MVRHSIRKTVVERVYAAASMAKTPNLKGLARRWLLDNLAIEISRVDVLLCQQTVNLCL